MIFSFILTSLLVGRPSFAEERILPPEEVTPTAGDMHIQANLTLNVQQPAERIDELISLAEENGGYFSTCTERDVHFKIPPQYIDSFIESSKEMGHLSEFDYYTNSIQTELENTRARIQAREGMIQQYMTILKTARLEAIVMVEREVLSLITQIENLKGRLRVLEHQSHYADVNISFQFRDRRAPVNTGSSPFDWINSLNFSELLLNSQNNRYGRAKSIPYSIPDGFAPYKKGPNKQAATPNGVLFQSYSVKNDPEAELDFWAGAVETRMIDAGYHSYTADGSLEGTQSGNSVIFQLSAPLGVDDYGYWVKIEVIDNKIWITEVTGKMSEFSAHEEAIKENLFNSP
jgi:hypothetical protein